MPDDPAATATEVKEPETIEEPQVTADFEEPKEEPDPAQIEIDSQPEKSAADRLFDSVMELDGDERNAALSSIDKRLEEQGESTPWRQRQDEDTAQRNSAASQLQERAQREQASRSMQVEADAAYKNVKLTYTNQHEQWEKRGIDDPAPRHDDAELDEQLNRYVKAESGLLAHGAIVSIGNTIQDKVNEHGGLTQEESSRLRTLTERPAVTRFLMEVLEDRVKEATKMELNKDIEKRIHDAVMAETAAIKAEAMREVQVAPEQTQTSAAGPKSPTYAEYNDATYEQRAEWKEQGIEAVAVQ